MRSREEIQDNTASGAGTPMYSSNINERLHLEVLLDIRDLLQEPTANTAPQQESNGSQTI